MDDIMGQLNGQDFETANKDYLIVWCMEPIVSACVVDILPLGTLETRNVNWTEVHPENNAVAYARWYGLPIKELLTWTEFKKRYDITYIPGYIPKELL